MKKNSGLKLAILIVAIIIVALISFAGIYKSENGMMKNIMPDYDVGKELNGTRLITFKVDDSDEEDSTISTDEDLTISTDENSEEETESTPVNSEEVLNEENYELAKNIIKNRLIDYNIINFDLRVDKETGTIALEVGEDEKIDDILSYLLVQGNFTIIDTESEEILLDNSKIKEAKTMYYQGDTGINVYLDIVFNDEGKTKLEEISKTYVETKDAEGNSTKKTITIKLDDETLTTTYFGQTMSNGELPLTVGSETSNQDTLKEYLTQSGQMEVLLNNGVNPIVYDIEINEYVSPIITADILRNIILFAILVFAIMLIYLIVKYRTFGILSSIALIGYTALYFIIVRFTDTIISLEAIAAIALSIILEFIFVQAIANKIKTKADNVDKTINKELIKNISIQIPLYIMGVVFVFVDWETVKSFGIAMFWGLIVSLIYNFTISKQLFIQKTNMMKTNKK